MDRGAYGVQISASLANTTDLVMVCEAKSMIEMYVAITRYNFK